MRWVLIFLFYLLSGPLPAQVYEFTLKNGLKVLVKEDHRAPIAVSMLWYNVGSADEIGGATGISHVIEHMMFKGTSKHPANDFNRSLAALGAEANALTHYDYTVYYEKILAAKLATSFELEADRMHNLLFNAGALTQEMNVIREERRMRIDDNPQALAFERYQAAAHLTTAYHHPIIGWMQDLYNVHLKTVKKWYQNYYLPNNAILVIVGDVNAKQIVRLAKHYFEFIPSGEIPPRPKQVEPPALGKKIIKIAAPTQFPFLMVGFTVPSVNTAKERWEPYALEVIAGLLGTGENARLSKNLVLNLHVASQTETVYNLYSRFQTQFIVVGAPERQHTIQALRNAFLGEIRRLKNELVSPEELQRIKTQITAQKTYEKDSIFAQAMELGMLETLGINRTTEDYLTQINQITSEQIQQVARHYFNEKFTTEVLLVPQQEKHNEKT